MLSEQYDRLINDFVLMSKSASNEFFDAVFYAVGYDFDETNLGACRLIGALLVRKGSDGTTYKYSLPPDFDSELTVENGVYHDVVGDESYLPERVAQRIKARKGIEAERRKNHDIAYMPNGKANNGGTVEGILLRANLCGKYQDVYPSTQEKGTMERIGDAFKKDWDRSGSGLKLLYILLFVYLLLSFIVMIKGG